MKDYSGSTNCMDCTKSSKFFKELLPSDLEFINQNRTQIHYKKGENICKQGAFASYVLYVADGLVKIYLEGKGNRNINIKISGSSEFIGLSTIFGGNIYTYSALALRESSICLIEKECFKKLLSKNGSFASEMLKWYCEKEIHLFHKIKSLGLKQMPGRLADVLLYLYNYELEHSTIFPYISRKDIAEFSCISTESVVRLLTDLKRDHIIEMQGRKIKILKLDALKEISWKG